MDFVDNDRGRQRFDFRISYGTISTLTRFTSDISIHLYIIFIVHICMYIGSFRSHGSKIAGILRAIFRSESRNMHFLENDETMGDKGIAHRVDISVTSCSSYRENKMIHLVDWTKIVPRSVITMFFSLRITRDILTTNVVISTLYLRTF